MGAHGAHGHAQGIGHLRSAATLGDEQQDVRLARRKVALRRQLANPRLGHQVVVVLGRQLSPQAPDLADLLVSAHPKRRRRQKRGHRHGQGEVVLGARGEVLYEVHREQHTRDGAQAVVEKRPGHDKPHVHGRPMGQRAAAQEQESQVEQVACLGERQSEIAVGGKWDEQIANQGQGKHRRAHLRPQLVVVAHGEEQHRQQGDGHRAAEEHAQVDAEGPRLDEPLKDMQHAEDHAVDDEVRHERRRGAGVHRAHLHLGTAAIRRARQHQEKHGQPENRPVDDGDQNQRRAQGRLPRCKLIARIRRREPEGSLSLRSVQLALS